MSIRQERIRGLDSLRGIAALLVVLLHYTTWFGDNYGHPEGLLFYFPIGIYGVPLFFMISGFVITMTLDRCDGVMDFCVSRFARLYPVYWFAVIVSFLAVVTAGLPGREVSAADAAINLTMCQHFVGIPDVDSIYWTLYIELCFYIIMGLLLALGIARHAVPALLILVAVNLSGFNYTWLFDIPGWWRIEPFFPRIPLDLLEHVHLFLIGVIAFESRKAWKWWHPIVLLIGLYDAKHGNTWEHVFVIAAIGLIVFAATRWEFRILCSRPLVLLGAISYSLYLIHANIGFIIIRWGYQMGIAGEITVIVTVALMIALAIGMTYLIERPANRAIRHRYEQFKLRRVNAVGSEGQPSS